MRAQALTLIVVLGLLGPASARGSWKTAKRYLKPTVSIVSETENVLVIRSPALPRNIVIATSPGKGVDVYRSLQRRRGSNPYWVWTATAQLCDDPKIPRRAWSVLFQTPFLRIIRRAKPK